MWGGGGSSPWDSAIWKSFFFFRFEAVFGSHQTTLAPVATPSIHLLFLVSYFYCFPFLFLFPRPEMVWRQNGHAVVAALLLPRAGQGSGNSVVGGERAPSSPAGGRRGGGGRGWRPCAAVRRRGERPRGDGRPAGGSHRQAIAPPNRRWNACVAVCLSGGGGVGQWGCPYLLR